MKSVLIIKLIEVAMSRRKTWSCPVLYNSLACRQRSVICSQRLSMALSGACVDQSRGCAAGRWCLAAVATMTGSSEQWEWGVVFVGGDSRIERGRTHE